MDNKKEMQKNENILNDEVILNNAVMNDTVKDNGKVSIIKKIINKITEMGYERIIVRLITSWLIICVVESIRSEYLFNTFDFFNGINIVIFIISIIILFTVLNVINLKQHDKTLLFFSAFIYGFYTIMTDERNIEDKLFFTIGVCIFMGAAAVYCVGSWIKIRTKKIPTIIIISALGIIFTLFVGGLTTLLYIRHYSSCFDFGIFAQMFTYMKETFEPLTTCERDGLLSHFAVHFSPVYYLMLPFFYIFPSPVTLLILQGAIVAIGLVPLYLLCRKYKFSNNAIILFAVCYVFMPSMSNGCFYFLHENVFLTPFILWLAYALENNKWIPTIVCAFLLLSVKEDAPVYAAVLGLYFVFSRRRLAKGMTVFCIAVIYFIVVSYFMAKYGEGTMSYRYDNFIYDGSGSLFTVIKAVILNPIYAISESFDKEKINFLLQMLVPVAFMPLMSKKPSRIILFIPFILINLMSDYQYQHDINFQYIYGSTAFLLYLMILNYNDMKPGQRCKVLAVAVCSSVFMFLCNTYYRINGISYYKNDIETGVIEQVDEALELLPYDASIAASTFFVPSLSDHLELYEFESTSHRSEVDYIVLDIRFGEESAEYYRTDPNYETVVDIPYTIAIFQKK